MMDNRNSTVPDPTGLFGMTESHDQAGLEAWSYGQTHQPAMARWRESLPYLLIVSVH